MVKKLILKARRNGTGSDKMSNRLGHKEEIDSGSIFFIDTTRNQSELTAHWIERAEGVGKFKPNARIS
jgi:hypothetical protein